MVTVRVMEQQDEEFLTDMLYESIHIVEGKPPKHKLLNEPHLKKYSEGWGRTGDRALLALNGDRPVGAAWYRLYDESNPGYGFVNSGTPELGIAILSEFRKQGIGRILMKAIIEQARMEGYPSLSLSVDPDNAAAVRLYEELGFQHCGVSGTSWTMKADLLEGGIL